MLYISRKDLGNIQARDAPTWILRRYRCAFKFPAPESRVVLEKRKKACFLFSVFSQNSELEFWVLGVVLGYGFWDFDCFQFSIILELRLKKRFLECWKQYPSTTALYTRKIHLCLYAQTAALLQLLNFVNDVAYVLKSNSEILSCFQFSVSDRYDSLEFHTVPTKCAAQFESRIKINLLIQHLQILQQHFAELIVLWLQLILLEKLCRMVPSSIFIYGLCLLLLVALPGMQMRLSDSCARLTLYYLAS